MKLQQGATLIDIDLIWINRDERQRRNVKTDDLEVSIGKRGLLNPIIISARETSEGLPQPWELKAGERRLTACRKLQMSKILCRKVTDLSPVEAQIIELEENIKRSDLEWQDLVVGVARIHKLYTELDPDWTMTETGVECGLTQGIVSMYMSVHVRMEEERVAKAGTVREAWNMLQRRGQREAGLALQELLETPDLPQEPVQDITKLTEVERAQVKILEDLGKPIPVEIIKKMTVVPVRKPEVVPVPDSILQASFLDWAPQYTGGKFNLIHCDFPYGVELFSGPQGRGSEIGEGGKLGYKDSVDTYQTLLKCFCTNLDRFMSVSGHLMFWLSADWRIIHDTILQFNMLAPSLKFVKFPLVWMKSDNAGISSDPSRKPRHVYEVCLLASRGDRNLARVKADAYSAPTDKRLHPSTKPEPMLRHFMEMLVDETTSLLDPTCGSGAALRAADSLGAREVLGLEIDPQYVVPAQIAMRQARAKRLAERSVEL